MAATLETPEIGLVITAGTASCATSAVTICDQVAGDPRGAVPNRPQIIQPLDVQIARAATRRSPSWRAQVRGAGAAPVTLQITHQFITAAESTIVQNVQGTVNLRPQAKQLLDLVPRPGSFFV